MVVVSMGFQQLIAELSTTAARNEAQISRKKPYRMPLGGRGDRQAWT
jgi:hypothetical protein